MPEGDTIHGLARRLRPLEGAALRCAEAHLAGKVRGLVGARVHTVRARGKHLLLDLDDETSLRVHLGIKGHGFWTDKPVRLSAEVGLVLGTADGTLAVSFPKVVDRFRTRDERTHRVLSQLGPDLCLDEVDVDEIVRRAQRRARDLVCHLLLDQHVAAGIGNVYRSELLFMTGLFPAVDVGDLSATTLRELYRLAARLLRANIGRTRTTTNRPAEPLFVYGRHRGSCLKCGTAIQTAQAAGRTIWLCPRCQPERRPV